MTTIQLLGVFQTLYPDGQMTLSRTLLISLVGFLIVFVILAIIALFVKGMGKAFDSLNAKKATAPVADTKNTSIIKETKKAVTGPVSVDLIDVTDEEAATVMAVVSDKSGIPLNRLKFNYIKKLSEDK